MIWLSTVNAKTKEKSHRSIKKSKVLIKQKLSRSMIGNVSDRAVTVVQFDYRITRFLSNEKLRDEESCNIWLLLTLIWKTTSLICSKFLKKRPIKFTHLLQALFEAEPIRLPSILFWRDNHGPWNPLSNHQYPCIILSGLLCVVEP